MEARAKKGKGMMANKKHYIFDLYGTLIDIHTDEEDPRLWGAVASFYSRYGADYAPDALKSAYRRTVCEELDAVRRATGVRFADIRLEKVFLRLYAEAPERRAAELTVRTEDQAVWAASVANWFREFSMRRFGTFPDVYDTLKTLKARGAHLYLLSNAQRVFSLPEIEKAGLRDYFEAIYLSSDYCMAKPEPAFLEALLRERRLDPAECLMIGNDRRSDMEIALACGVQGVLLNTDGYADAELDAMIAGTDLAVIRSGRIRELTEREDLFSS